MDHIDMTKCATVSLEQAAHVLGIHRSTVWSLSQSGALPVPVLRIGGSLRIVKSHLETYLATGIRVELVTPSQSLESSSRDEDSPD